MKKFIGYVMLFLAFILLDGCASRKSYRHEPTRDLHPVPYCEHGSCECPPNYAYNSYSMGCKLSLEPVPGHPGVFFGPEHRECHADNSCEQVRDWITADGAQVLSPLGCAMKKAYFLQVFWIGKKHKPVCESEIRGE